ncbi:hypothetical protein Dda_7403 [Drechslerella dactyloides]|uniref:Receptor-activated Ca2+-permeable cation channel n=1 Tax=Drechslerella dactyloides TaxID=74499 RepID=A0AAD6ISJ8_DREDA|nr:hypothetical protein Dda_7403 [Drechslerella dactyloides]
MDPRETEPLLRDPGFGRHFRHYHVEAEQPMSLPLVPEEEEEDEDDDDDVAPEAGGIESGQRRRGTLSPRIHTQEELQPHAHLPVYYTIHRIRNEVVQLIDDPYSMSQLRDPRMNTSIVRPLVDKYYEMGDVSIVFCLLVNRMQFRSEQSQQVREQSVNRTRAILCELVANRILRRFSEDNPGPQGLLLLANILVAGFSPFQGAPDSIQHENLPKDHWAGNHHHRHPALEIAIVSQSKLFLASGACQQVVTAIYIGQIVYTPSTFMDIIPDHYKHVPISLYDPRKAPLLNQYRLMVPRTRNTIEVCEFVTLLGLYVWVMMKRPQPHEYQIEEMWFGLYACGWILEMFATVLEHGWFVYTQNLWSFLDVTFAVIFAVYAALRLHGFRTESPVPGQQALDVLAVAATILVPRLAFNVMSENMLFVSLRSMMADFAMLTGLAGWCFVGFLLSMLWVGEGKHNIVTVTKWMLWVWFGLDGTGIDRSGEFHWALGPALMVTYAFLGYLFLVILVSMLSTTFSNLHSEANAEIQFRRAVLTLEGVKSDSIFSYVPPFNLFAVTLLLPLKYVITPRWFHKINVACIRTLNLPVLLFLAWFERRAWWAPRPHVHKVKKPRPQMGKRAISMPGLTRTFSAHGNIQAVFRAESDRITREEELAAESAPEDGNGSFNPAYSMRGQDTPGYTGGRPLGSAGSGGSFRKSARRDSVMPFGDMMPDQLAILSTAGDESEAGGVKQRVQVLEDRLKNIEDMLEILVAKGRKDSDGAGSVSRGSIRGGA